MQVPRHPAMWAEPGARLSEGASGRRELPPAKFGEFKGVMGSDAKMRRGNEAASPPIWTSLSGRTAIEDKGCRSVIEGVRISLARQCHGITTMLDAMIRRRIAIEAAIGHMKWTRNRDTIRSRIFLAARITV